MSGRALPAWRQVLWVAAGVVLLSLVVVAASWLFSPRPTEFAPGPSAFKLPEQKVEKSTFIPESPGPTSEERFKPETGVKPTAAVTGSSPVSPAPALSPQPPEFPKTKPEALFTPPTPKPAAPAPKASPISPPAAPAAQESPVQPMSVPPSPKSPTPAAKGLFGVQVGAFSTADNARSVKQKLEAGGYRVALLAAGKATKVVVQGYSDRPAAEKALASLKAAGYSGAFVVPLE